MTHTATGREIDRQIAERLGWRSEQYTAESYMHHPSDVGKTYWRLWKGDKITDWYRTFEFEVWQNPEILNWSTDLNAAMSLVRTAQPCYFELSYSPDRFNWRAMFTPVGRMDEMKFADAREPAEAICRAWLAYTAATSPAGAGETPAGRGE